MAALIRLGWFIAYPLLVFVAGKNRPFAADTHPVPRLSCGHDPCRLRGGRPTRILQARVWMVKAQAMQIYPDFLDSTDLLNDGRTLRVRLDRDGYLFIRDLLPARAILAVRERLLAEAASGGWLDPDSLVQAGIANPASACKDPEDRYMRVFRRLWTDEELHRLRIHPILTDLFTRIFGEPALAHPMFVQRNIFPQPTGSTSPPAPTRTASISVAPQVTRYGCH
jgi:hypothetical protein